MEPFCLKLYGCKWYEKRLQSQPGQESDPEKVALKKDKSAMEEPEKKS